MNVSIDKVPNTVQLSQMAALDDPGISSAEVVQAQSADFVYALGSLRPFFATQDLQKEYDAAASDLGLATDDYFGVFSYSTTPNNNEELAFRPFLYIAEKACWVFSINNVDTYLVVPRYENELDALIRALDPKQGLQQQALIGTLGPISAEKYCDDLRLPIVICHQLMLAPTNAMADILLKLNDGVAVQNRAVNFLSFHYPTIVPVDLVLPEPLVALNYQHYTSVSDSPRVLVEVILTYFNKGVEVFYSCGIDVTDQYPFVDFPLRSYLPSKT